LRNAIGYVITGGNRIAGRFEFVWLIAATGLHNLVGKYRKSNRQGYQGGQKQKEIGTPDERGISAHVNLSFRNGFAVIIAQNHKKRQPNKACT
jgi:hypothetical protein